MLLKAHYSGASIHVSRLGISGPIGRRLKLNVLLRTSFLRIACVDSTVRAMAAEHGTAQTVVHSMSLRELTPASRGVGKWFVRVTHVRVDSWKWGANKGKDGETLRTVLVSEDGALYCLGTAKLMSDAAKAKDNFQKAVAKFQVGKVFEMTKVAFDDKQEKAWNATPVKHTIDLMKTTMKAVLQNTLKLPQWPEPAPDLAQLLEVPHTQLCDVTAFVSKVGDARTGTTKNGPRNIVDVTLLDGSTTGDGKTAQVSIPLFFTKNNTGDAMLAALKDAVDFATPVSFFGLLCTPHGDQASIATSPAEFSLRHCPDGTKAERLKQNAENFKSLLESDIQDIVRAPTWEPQSRKDWKAEPATQSSCYLLHAALEGGAELYRKRVDAQDGGSGSQALVQLNNVRVMEPDSSGDVANLHR